MIATISEYLSLGLIPAFLLLDLVTRHHKFKSPRHWRLVGLAVSVGTIFLTIQIATGWGRLIGDRALFDLSGLGIAGGALVGILVYEFLHYWYHRTVHSHRRLFRWAHQMHHAPEANDAWGANYMHPIDAFMFTTMASLVFFPLLGLAPAAGAVAGTFLVFNAMFQHANIRTPRWLGYIIQRPESHSIHHKRRYHRNNYSDLPVYDLIFGTFENPEGWAEECGYWDGASYKVLPMLLGRNVVKPAPKADAPADQSTEPAQSSAA